LLRDPQFQQKLLGDFKDYAILTQHPVWIPKALAARKFLFIERKFRDNYENKAAGRQNLAGIVDFPPYKVFDRHALRPVLSDFKAVMGGRREVILQDERLSGGAGSIIIADFQQYETALASLEMRTRAKRLVVSDVIRPARERSIQACVTKHGILTGPLQRQVMRQPALVDPAMWGSDQYCGFQVVASDQGNELNRQAAAAAEAVGRHLQSQGYKGIFGIDFMADESGKLWTIEVNPRLTSTTSLLSQAWQPGNAPLLLLHILEIGGYEYQLKGEPQPYSGSFASLLLHTRKAGMSKSAGMPDSGRYSFAGGLKKLDASTDFAAIGESEFCLYSYVAGNVPAKPGARLANAIFRQAVTGSNDEKLLPAIATAITSLNHDYGVKTID
jgi:hypothetical protein